MSDITFQVIDLNCEKSDQSFFPPRISMTTRSQTKIATVLGFDEYIPSVPPKRYKSLNWSGSSEHQFWYPGSTPGNSGPDYQVAGARYDYSGTSTIDLHGNYVSLYKKDLFQMCNAVPVGAYNGLVPGILTAFEHYPIAGWIGPAINTLCDLPGVPYDFVADGAIGNGGAARMDSSNLWGSLKPNPNQNNFQVSNFQIVNSTEASCHDVNSDHNAQDMIVLVESLPLSVSRDIIGPEQGTVWFFAYVLWDHDYTATLTDEYTDADALSVARVINGNGATAQNMPRTTGFISSFTTVTFTLTCINLIVGQSYLVSYDLADLTAGTSSTVQLGFIAGQTTHSITASIPTPAAGHSVIVRNPKISFSPQ